MITVSVCYSNKSGQEFASCTLGGVELGPELLDQPAVLAVAIRRAYDRCREAVETQLTNQAAAAPPAAVVNPVPVQAPPPPAVQAAPLRPAALPATPPPAVAPPVAPLPPGKKTFYGNGRSQDGPPTTGSQLGGVAKKLGALGFFEALGAAQNPPLPRFVGDWPNDWAVWAWAQYQAACIPPAVPVPTNGTAAPH